MRNSAMGFVISALFTGAAVAQAPVDRVFNFNHTETEQNIKEVVTLIRTMTDMRDVTADLSTKSVALRGTAEQLKLADWLLTELDRPAQRIQSPVTHEYRAGTDDLVRLFYITGAATVQDFQEIATAIRSTAEIRRVFTYNAPRALTMRGTADQIALAEWLINHLDRPAQPGQEEYRMPGTGDNVVRVFYLTHTQTIQSFQEVATLVRTIAEIRRAFTYNTPRALTLRGTAEQMALAVWLINELDKPPSGQPSAAYEYAGPGGGIENVVRVFYLTHTATVADFQKIAIQIRTATSIRRVFTYNEPRALALRGTASQIAQAEQMIKNLD